MHFFGRKTQAFRRGGHLENIAYITSYFALHILVLLLSLADNIQVVCLQPPLSLTQGRYHHQHPHRHHHHHHHKHQSQHANRHRIPGKDEGAPLPDPTKRRRLDRAVYMAYDHSRINSSESLASSWFYQQDQPAILEQCCACDEAKYELVFEGLWSKYTHPDDFPENYWLAYFSDIIGASHSNDFRMWAQDTLASEGVRELAETGATKKLESELKQVSSKTRTIIKARELRYPTLNSKTSAVFRTDKHHHLVSILSKLGPSPDWMVGVSSLELCQVDCTWAAQRVVNLYLWDAGTDSGTNFTASDLPSRPQERIHPYARRQVGGSGSQVSANPTRLTMDQQQQAMSSGNLGSLMQYERFQQSQDQSRGSRDNLLLPPLVDEAAGAMSPASAASMQQQDQMKPFARLTVTRQRIYEKSCNANNGMLAADLSATYSRPSSYNQMTQQQQQHQEHQHSSHLHPTINSDTLIGPTRASYSDCRFTDWSDWSSCSSTCGKGIRTRTRSFYDDQAHLAAGCSQSDLIEKEICLADCVGNASCVTHDWSEWTKCSVNCGLGYRKRTRSPIGQNKAACASVELAEMEQCTGSCNETQDSQDDGGGNQQSSSSSSKCAVGEWSQWSECSVACGRGTKIRTRQFVRRDDLESCQQVKLLHKQPCQGRPELCKQVGSKNHAQQQHDQSIRNQQQHLNQKQINFELPVIDCKLSNWSPWSTCSALCGSGKRTRSRYIIQMPQNGGKPCDKRLSRTQKCKDLPQCPKDFSVNTSGSPQGGHTIRNNKAAIGNGAGHHQQPTSTQVSAFGHYRTTTTTTTPGSSMMDDEDDSKFSRLLKAELGHLQLANWLPTESYISDSAATSTEMELIGSSSFQIRNGLVYPFSPGAGSKERPPSSSLDVM